MGRDKVLGLSLAILLIGFAGAFCFRNEQFVESGLKLARAKILDEAIAQRPGPKPYASESKAEREKTSLPTVTLQGIQSIEPFSDLQKDQPADREKATASKEKKTMLAEIATDRGDIKPSAEPKTPAIGTQTTAAGNESLPVDTERASPESNPSKIAAAPAPPLVDGTPASSEPLTSAAPPAGDLSTGENQAPSADIVIRPNSPLGGRTDSLVQQNVAWQSTPKQSDRGPLADNSPRDSSALDNPTGDGPGDNSSRDRWTRDNPVRDNFPRGISTRDNSSRETEAGDRPDRDCPSRDSALHDSALHVSPPGDNPTAGNSPGDTDGAPTSVTYRVRRGDTLTKIALHYLGDANRYREIFQANRDLLRSPNDRLKIGMTLRIPSNTAKPDKASGPVARRKSRSNRSAHVVEGSSRTRKAPIRNISRVRETPPNATIERSPAATSEDENGNSDPQPTNRFGPVRKAPFLPTNPQAKGSAKSSGHDLSHQAPDNPPGETSTSGADAMNTSPREETEPTKAKADKQPPANNGGDTAPDMSHYRFFSRAEPVKIAGDREDAIVR